MDPLFDFKNGKHFAIRAHGQLKRPIQRDGYVNNVKLQVQSENTYQESMEPGKYRNALKQPHGNKTNFKNIKRQQMIAKNDDF